MMSLDPAWKKVTDAAYLAAALVMAILAYVKWLIPGLDLED